MVHELGKNHSRNVNRNLLDCQFKMNVVTCNALLKVLLGHGKMSDALALLDDMLIAHTTLNFQAMNTYSYNLMVNESFRLGKLAEAIAIFKRTATKPRGRVILEAEKLFEEMRAKSVRPDPATYHFLIDAYCREGKVDDIFLTLFEKLVGETRLEADVVIGLYNKVLDRLSQS
ncbi:hypothetical protein ACLOJK_023382 [Asimina triloba]